MPKPCDNQGPFAKTTTAPIRLFSAPISVGQNRRSHSYKVSKRDWQIIPHQLPPKKIQQQLFSSPQSDNPSAPTRQIEDIQYAPYLASINPTHTQHIITHPYISSRTRQRQKDKMAEEPNVNFGSPCIFYDSHPDQQPTWIGSYWQTLKSHLYIAWSGDVPKQLYPGMLRLIWWTVRYFHYHYYPPLPTQSPSPLAQIAQREQPSHTKSLTHSCTKHRPITSKASETTNSTSTPS